MGPLTEGSMRHAEKKRNNVRPKAPPPAPIPKKSSMCTITIMVDSVLQTEEEISGFTKDIVNSIKNHWLLNDISLSITHGKNNGDYNLKIGLPEII